MEKEEYFSLWDFKHKLSPESDIETNEGHIFFKGNYAYKIFDEICRERYYAKIRNVKRINKLDNNLFTVPISLIFFDDRFVGFKMINSGVSLWHKYLCDGLDLEEKKSIAYDLKDIDLYLRKKGIIHFDIHLKNILYLNGQIKLTDINGVVKLSYFYRMQKKLHDKLAIRMPRLYNYWLITYGAEYLTYIEINFCMHILFNFSPQDLKGIAKFVHHGDMFKLLDQPNLAFEEDVFLYFEETFNQKSKRLEPNTYLVDHLK